MKLQISLDDTPGKIVEGVHFFIGGQAVIVFTDGTYASLGVDCGNQKGDECVTAEEIDFKKTHDSELVKAGIASQEELDSFRDELNLKLQRMNLEIEKVQFLCLSKKFMPDIYQAAVEVIRLDSKLVFSAGKIN